MIADIGGYKMPLPHEDGSGIATIRGVIRDTAVYAVFLLLKTYYPSRIGE